MDQKAPANLDPKLKEAYERVMGMSATPAQPASTPPSQPAAQAAVQTQPQAYSSSFVGQPASGVAAGAVHTGTAAKAASGGSSIMTVVYIVAGVVFILAYTLFWIKILNFQTPFPLPF